MGTLPVTQITSSSLNWTLVPPNEDACKDTKKSHDKRGNKEMCFNTKETFSPLNGHINHHVV